MSVTVDIKENGIVINGTEFAGKIVIDDLKNVLGEPRLFELKPDKNLQEALEQKFGKGNVHVIKYTWDNLGIYANTNDGKLITDMGFAFNNRDKTAPQTPKSDFAGTITLNGNSWLQEMRNSKSFKAFKTYYNVKVGGYYMFAEFLPESKDKEDKTEDDFALIALERVSRKEK